GLDGLAQCGALRRGRRLPERDLRGLEDGRGAESRYGLCHRFRQHRYLRRKRYLLIRGAGREPAQNLRLGRDAEEAADVGDLVVDAGTHRLCERLERFDGKSTAKTAPA